VERVCRIMNNNLIWGAVGILLIVFLLIILL
jgi:hypothetical protein